VLAKVIMNDMFAVPCAPAEVEETPDLNDPVGETKLTPEVVNCVYTWVEVVDTAVCTAEKETR
jgi:hypothetical protein